MGRPDVRAIVDIDHHSDEYAAHEQEINADLRRRCPVAWNERHGGFWFVTGYDAVTEAALDGEVFACDGVRRYSGNPTMTGLGNLPVTFAPGAPLGTPRPQ